MTAQDMFGHLAFSYMNPPSSASMSSRPFFVSSSFHWKIYLLPEASVSHSNESVLKFSCPRLQKKNITCNQTLFIRSAGVDVSNAGLSYIFFKSSLAIGGLCCILALPCHFNSINLALNTALASSNSLPFIMSTSGLTLLM